MYGVYWLLVSAWLTLFKSVTRPAYLDPILVHRLLLRPNMIGWMSVLVSPGRQPSVHPALCQCRIFVACLPEVLSPVISWETCIISAHLSACHPVLPKARQAAIQGSGISFTLILGLFNTRTSPGLCCEHSLLSLSSSVHSLKPIQLGVFVGGRRRIKIAGQHQQRNSKYHVKHSLDLHLTNVLRC